MPTNPATAAPPTIPPGAPGDVLLNSRQVRNLFGDVSDMSLWRWVRDGVLPEPIYIRKRRYWWRSVIIRAVSA
jgi:hypothetical protein